jgi:uncharacterized membrane protein YphA (DoxX/SURF4 family)
VRLKHEKGVQAAVATYNRRQQPDGYRPGRNRPRFSPRKTSVEIIRFRGAGSFASSANSAAFHDRAALSRTWHWQTVTFPDWSAALIVLGLFTRPVALVLFGYIAAAYFMAHFPTSSLPAVNGGDAAVLYCFIFLLLALPVLAPLAIDRELDAPGGATSYAVPRGTS